MEYIYGKNTIMSFLEEDILVEVYLDNNFKDNKVLEKLNKSNVKISYKERNYLNKITNNGNHQGMVGLIKEYKYFDLDYILSKSLKKEKSVILVLDGIEDPHNLGAIIRTCEAFSIDGIIISKHNCCPVNATVAKVSTGTIANVMVSQVPSLIQAINKLKENGYWIYAAEANQGKPYNQIEFDKKSVLIVGSEGKGISRLVKENSDFNIYIPMSGKVNSLNVSVATAILLSKMI